MTDQEKRQTSQNEIAVDLGGIRVTFRPSAFKKAWNAVKDITKNHCYKCGRHMADFTPHRRNVDPLGKEPLYFTTNRGDIICIPCVVSLINEDAEREGII